MCSGAASSQQAAPSSERLDGRSQHPLRQRGERGCHLDVYGDHKTGYEKQLVCAFRARLVVALASK